MPVKVGVIAIVLVAAGAGLVAAQALAFDRLYPRTPVGEIEVKELPARTALATVSTGSYFESDDGLFMTLFDFIKNNDIAMTVPVEAEIESAEMRFFVGKKQGQRSVESSDSVEVGEVGPQTVVSFGLRGGYTEEVFERGRQALEGWLSEHSEWSALAEPYAVYWDGPYIPVPFRRSEVHVRIARVNP